MILNRHIAREEIWLMHQQKSKLLNKHNFLLFVMIQLENVWINCSGKIETFYYEKI